MPSISPAAYELRRERKQVHKVHTSPASRNWAFLTASPDKLLTRRLFLTFSLNHNLLFKIRAKPKKSKIKRTIKIKKDIMSGCPSRHAYFYDGDRVKMRSPDIFSVVFLLTPVPVKLLYIHLLFNRGKIIRAGIAQLVERDLAKVDVAGSSPVSRSIFILHTIYFLNRNPNLLPLDKKRFAISLPPL